MPEPPLAPEPPTPAAADLSSTGIRGWLDVARRAIREGDDFDPGPMIEQRVLQQIDENMRQQNQRRADKQGRKQRSGPPELPDFSRGIPSGVPDFSGAKPAKKSVADDLERLRTLHDQGALNDEQYAKAVDRVLSEG